MIKERQAELFVPSNVAKDFVGVRNLGYILKIYSGWNMEDTKDSRQQSNIAAIKGKRCGCPKTYGKLKSFTKFVNGDSNDL